MSLNYKSISSEIHYYSNIELSRIPDCAPSVVNSCGRDSQSRRPITCCVYLRLMYFTPIGNTCGQFEYVFIRTNKLSARNSANCSSGSECNHSRFVMINHLRQLRAAVWAVVMSFDVRFPHSKGIFTAAANNRVRSVAAHYPPPVHHRRNVGGGSIVQKLF